MLIQDYTNIVNNFILSKLFYSSPTNRMIQFNMFHNDSCKTSIKDYKAISIRVNSEKPPTTLPINNWSDN